LSYTSFQYNWITKPVVKQDSIKLSVEISNTGNYNSKEVAQVYIEYPADPAMPLKELKAFKKPLKELKAFKKISLNTKETSVIDFSIPLSELKKWNKQQNNWQLYKGNYSIFVGSNSNDKKIISSLHIK